MYLLAVDITEICLYASNVYSNRCLLKSVLDLDSDDGLGFCELHEYWFQTGLILETKVNFVWLDLI